MLSCSAAFTTAAAASIRKPKARVTITWTDPYIDPGISTTVYDENRVDWPNQVADIEENVPYKWAHADNTTPLSALMHPAPGTADEAADYQMGWWGSREAGVDGAFSVPVPNITVEFSARPVVTLRVSGDDQYNEYPVDFAVTIYNGATVLATVNVTDNSELTWIYDISSTGINSADSMSLSISKWSAAGRVVKISEFYTSISAIYTGDDIMEMNITEEMEIKDGTLPIGNISANEIDLKLNNVDDKFFPDNTAAALYTLVKKNRRIVAELGFTLADGTTEYMPMGTYWSGDWQTSEMGTTSTTSGRDRMELLRKSTFYTGTIYTNVTLKTLAETVLADAKTLMPDLQYSVADGLSDYTVPYAWFEKVSHFEALREIAEACMGYAYCDRAGVVQVTIPVADTIDPVLEITSANYFDRNQPAKSEDLANRIEVKTSPWTPADVAEEVYTSKEDITIGAGETVEIQCDYSTDKRPVLEAVADLTGESTATISSAAYYAWGAIIRVYSVSADTCKITISGKPFSIVGSETVAEQDDDSIREFGVQTYVYPENKLIQTRAMAETIAEGLLRSYAIPRKDTELDWRGHPALELADPVTIPEYVKGAVNNRGIFYITRQSHQFDGTYRAKLEGRKISDVEIAEIYQDTDAAAEAWQDTEAAAALVQA